MDSAKGWRLVPVEIPPEMLRRCESAGVSFATLNRVWPIALAAAPVPADSAPAAGMVEAVARIINPVSWERHDRLIADAEMLELERDGSSAAIEQRELAGLAVQPSIEKATAIFAAIPLIEAQVIERCAGVAKAARAKYRERNDWDFGALNACSDIETAIRALSPAGDAGGGGK